MQVNNGPYALVVLREPARERHRQELLPLLALAYSLSVYVRFLFPMASESVQVVDAAFDHLLKEMPLSSKGIGYERDLGPDELVSLLDGSEFVIAASDEWLAYLSRRKIPHLSPAQGEGQAPLARGRFLNRMRDGNLRSQLIAGVGLVNVANHHSPLLHLPHTNGQVKLPEIVARRSRFAEHTELS